jgi:hypothetical protein
MPPKEADAFLELAEEWLAFVAVHVLANAATQAHLSIIGTRAEQPAMSRPDTV